MPKMTEAVQRSTGSLREELSDRLAKNIDPAEHPIYNSIKAGPRINQMLVAWHAKTYPATVSTAIPDGTPAAGAQRTTRIPMSAYAHYFRQQYGATPLAVRSNNAAGIGRNELAEQRSDALVLLERQKEIQFTSNSDTAADNGTTGYTSRGIMKWLSSTAQSTLPVDSSLLPASANHYTSALSSYSEDSLMTQINSMYAQRKGRLNLDFFAASALKNKVDTFTIIHPDASTTNQARVQYVVQGVETLKRNVNIIDCSTAMVRVHLVYWINHDPTTGTANTNASRTGFFLDTTMWEIRALGPTTHLPLADDGSGPSGLFESQEGLFCLNPLAQGYVEATA